MCFSFFPFFWKNSLKELEREDQELSFFLFFSLFALLCLVSLCFSFFFFFWLGNGGFHSEAGETLEGSFSAISKSNFASKILNTKLELESLRKRDWKTMDIDEKNEIFKKIVIFLFEKWTQNFQNIWIVVADFPPLALPCFYDLSGGAFWRAAGKSLFSFDFALRWCPGVIFRCAATGTEKKTQKNNFAPWNFLFSVWNY